MRLGSKYITVLDINDEYIRCAQVKRSSGGWRVWRSAVEKNVSSDENMPYVVRSLLQEIDASPPKNVVISISGRDASIKLFDFPPMDDERLRDVEGIVRYELTAHLPMKIETTYYDYQIIGSDAHRTQILTVAVKRNVLNKILDLLSSADVYPNAVTVSSLVLFNAFAVKEPETIRNGTVGLIVLRDPNGDIVISENGKLAYARSFQIGAGKEQLIREIHNSLDTYLKSRSMENEISGEPMRAIHLLTGDGQLPLGLTGEDLLRMMPGVQWKIRAESDMLILGTFLAGSKLTIPLSRRSLSPVRINLFRQIMQERRIASRSAMKAKLRKLSPTIAIALLTIASGIFWWQSYQAKEKLALLENARLANEKRNAYAVALAKTGEELKERIKYLGWAEDSSPMISYRLYKIAEALPPILWLKEIYTPENKDKKETLSSTSKLYVVGYAHKQDQIEKFIDNLKKCDCFLDVRQESISEILLSGDRVLEFTIGLTSGGVR